MEFRELSESFEKIENTSSRNEITQLLSTIFNDATAIEAKEICYLTLGRVCPPYIVQEFNLAEKTVVEVISRVLNISKEEINAEFRNYGDWGDYLRVKLSNKVCLLTIEDVYRYLTEISLIQGSGAQLMKLQKFKHLIDQLDGLSAKYVIRIILKKIRLGFSEMTILDALSWMISGSKEYRKLLEEAYSISADMGNIAQVVKEKGLKGLSDIKIKVGIPIVSSAAERLSSPKEIFDKLGPSYLEPKIDGFRLQVHLDHSKKESFQADTLFVKEKSLIRFFSRNLEDMTPMFPDLSETVENINCKNIILEGEAVVYDSKSDTFLPFQQTISRKRKYGIEEKVKELPLTLFVFDLLYLNNKSYIDVPFSLRRKVLEELFDKDQYENILLIPQKKANSVLDIQNFFEEKKKEKLEGIMVKKKESSYIAGARGFHWVKYKRSEESKLLDTIDTVVLGYYLGEGKRTSFGIGAFLVGVYNDEKGQFETIAKIGTGVKDEEFITIKKELDAIRLKDKPKNLVVSRDLYPTVWVEPRIVAVVLADEITLSPQHTAGMIEDKGGYALRFPRLIEWNRKDKDPYQVTTVKEIKKLYEQQGK